MELFEGEKKRAVRRFGAGGGSVLVFYYLQQTERIYLKVHTINKKNS